MRVQWTTMHNPSASLWSCLGGSGSHTGLRSGVRDTLVSLPKIIYQCLTRTRRQSFTEMPCFTYEMSHRLNTCYPVGGAVQGGNGFLGGGAC